DDLRLSARRRELLLMLQQTGAMKDALARLLGEKKNLPTEDHAPIPIPNVDRRQYLTGVRLHGDFVVFVIRMSGSMLGDTIDDAASRLDDTDEKKRGAEVAARRSFARMDDQLARPRYAFPSHVL